MLICLKKYSGVFVGGLVRKQFLVQGKIIYLILLFIFLLFYCAMQNSNFSESVYSKYLVQFYNLSIFPDLKNWPLKSVLGPIDFYSIFVHTMEVSGTWNHLVTNILQNIFFCVSQKIESHTGLKNMR